MFFRCWKLFLNALIFFLIPINCCKCCRKDDSDIFFCKKAYISKQFFSDDEEQGIEEDESLIASKNSHLKYCCSSSESIFEAQNFKNFNEQDETDIVDDTEFIVKAINESHESLSKSVRCINESLLKKTLKIH